MDKTPDELENEAKRLAVIAAKLAVISTALSTISLILHGIWWLLPH